MEAEGLNALDTVLLLCYESILAFTIFVHP